MSVCWIVCNNLQVGGGGTDVCTNLTVGAEIRIKMTASKMTFSMSDNVDQSHKIEIEEVQDIMVEYKKV